MPQYELGGDETGLPKTRRSQIPYETESLSPREVWGAGNGATSLICKQTWEESARWIKDMVGSVSVAKPGSQLLLQRDIPEPLQYGGGDTRVQFCTSVDQTSQGDNPGGVATANFAQSVTYWPATDWIKYRATWEAMPYAILHDTESVMGLPSMAEVQAGAGAYAGAIELYRYVIRSRRTFSREQPIPAASTAGGFKTIEATPQRIGQVGFQVVGMADVQYRWVRVPVGWPPPVGWTAPATPNHWPPKYNPQADNPATLKRARDSYIGTINNDWWDAAAADGYAWPPGTLLYTGYDDSFRYFDAAGDWVCDVVYNFKAKLSVDNTGSYGGWNYFLDALGAWREVSLDGTSGGTKPYKTNNFNNLFQYA